MEVLENLFQIVTFTTAWKWLALLPVHTQRGHMYFRGFSLHLGQVLSPTKRSRAEMNGFTLLSFSLGMSSRNDLGTTFLTPFHSTSSPTLGSQ